MLLELERDKGSDIDALVMGLCWNTNVIMAWAWMLWFSDALGRPGMLSEHETFCYGLGTDAMEPSVDESPLSLLARNLSKVPTISVWALT